MDVRSRRALDRCRRIYTKAVAHPERDREQRLLRALRRGIHGYHRLLGREASGARLVELDLTSLISWGGEWYVVHLHGLVEAPGRW
jgi:hypothetical protein